MPRGTAQIRRLVAVAVLPPLLIAFPAIFAVWEATVRASWTSLGRDQGIFQYVAWAVRQGDVAYRDIRDVNGPVITIVHTVFQSLGGTDEHRFRVLDLLANGLAFVSAGGCLPLLVQEKTEPGGDRVTRLAQVAWAAAAWVALSAQYVVYGFWDTAQRESFLDWFVLTSIALGVTAGARGRAKAQAQKGSACLLTLASGAASFVPWLGKPTFALFTLSQIAAIGLEAGPLRARLRQLVTFLAGGAVGLAVPLLFLLVFGDLRAWARITFVDVPTMYRFIWPSPPLDILSLPGYSEVATTATLTSLGLGVLILAGKLPRRAIPIATMPVLGLASVFIQAKGFPYHFHPVTLGSTFGWLAAIAAVWELWRVRVRERDPAQPRGWLGWMAWSPYAVAAAAVVVGGHARLLALRSPDPPAPSVDQRDKASLASGGRLAAFDRVDFFPRALRDAAEYVAARTASADRVQTYGMDAYLLFLAGRRSATPYLYSYDLNADAALYGSFSPDGPRPSPAEQGRIRALRDEHARDLLARLEQAPPAAFVFIDRSPLMSSPDAVGDFSAHCPEAAAWVAAHYRQTAEFLPIRVWLREDLALREEPAQAEPPPETIP